MAISGFRAPTVAGEVALYAETPHILGKRKCRARTVTHVGIGWRSPLDGISGGDNMITTIMDIAWGVIGIVGVALIVKGVRAWLRKRERHAKSTE